MKKLMKGVGDVVEVQGILCAEYVWWSLCTLGKGARIWWAEQVKLVKGSWKYDGSAASGARLVKGED